MQLQSLRVWHASKKLYSAEELNLLQAHVLCLDRPLFIFDSCQRTIWVGSDELPNDLQAESDFIPGFEGDEWSGADAYSFLLRVALGLESQVVAETDVFGQLKEAWQQWSKTPSPLSAQLSPWIQRLFQDAKELRAAYLQNVGAGSYGSLLRKLLKHYPDSEPTLLIGAGKLAQSVAPYLLEFGKLQIWNRISVRSEALTRSLTRSLKGNVETVSSLETTAERVIIAVPSASALDAQIIASRAGRGGVVVHLGLLEANAGAWKGVAGFHSLNDIFAMQDSLEQVRNTKILEARRECEERAKLRALGGSLSLAHGWEDLAVFA